MARETIRHLKLKTRTLVEVFKTNIHSRRMAGKVKKCLREAFPNHNIDFDLNDCDRILRIESDSLDCKKIIEIVKSNNVFIALLED